MPPISKLVTRKTLDKATGENHIIFSDKIIYQMCANQLYHVDDDIIKGKLMMIGRVYAASIERTKKQLKLLPKEDFYLKIAAPTIRKSKIDKLIKEAKDAPGLHLESAPLFIGIHQELVDIFERISGKSNRSLASKYLHFHAPNKFFILDKFAKDGAKQFQLDVKNDVKRVKTKLHKPIENTEYLRHFVTCLKIRELIKDFYKKSLDPRQIDNLLLPLGRKANS
jgi:hypothetical protein